MNFLQRLLRRFLGKRNQHDHHKPAPPPPVEVTADMLASLQREDEERADSLLPEIRPLVLRHLAAQPALSFTWESGGDESFVYFPGMSAEQEEECWPLGEYLTFRLEIPDAGEFQMRGRGELFQKDGAVWARYSSVLRETIDYDEKTEQEIYGEETIVEEEERRLFSIAG